jgi:hypothetical protein
MGASFPSAIESAGGMPAGQPAGRRRYGSLQFSRQKCIAIVVTFGASDAAFRQEEMPRRVSGHSVCGGFMENRTLGNSTTTSSQTTARPHEGRNVWVLTAYAISGLALFGVLIYYVSSYITQ